MRHPLGRSPICNLFLSTRARRCRIDRSKSKPVECVRTSAEIALTIRQKGVTARGKRTHRGLTVCEPWNHAFQTRLGQLLLRNLQRNALRIFENRVARRKAVLCADRTAQTLTLPQLNRDLSVFNSIGPTKVERLETLNSLPWRPENPSSNRTRTKTREQHVCDGDLSAGILKMAP